MRILETDGAGAAGFRPAANTLGSRVLGAAS
jgi:hypothetical protein